MEQNVHIILVAVGWCMLILIYFMAFGRRRKNRIVSPTGETPTGNKLLPILKSLDEKTSSVVTGLEENTLKLLNEKSNLESELNRKRQAGKEIITGKTRELEGLKRELSGILEECSKHDVPSLRQEIYSLKAEYENITREAGHKHQERSPGTEQPGIEQARAENVRTDGQIREKLRQLDSIKQKNKLIQDEIENLKKAMEDVSISGEKTNRNASQEALKLKEQIQVAGLEIEKFNNFVKEKDGLQKQIAGLTAGMRSQKEKFLREKEAKEEGFKKLSVELQQKQKLLQETYREQERELISAREELNEEIKRLQEQLDKKRQAAKESRVQTQGEIRVLQGELGKLEMQLKEVRQKRTETEETVKSKLRGQIEQLQKRFAEASQKIKLEMKSMDETVNRLMIRFSVREDKLMSDMQKRERLQKDLLSELQAASGRLREKLKSESSGIEAQLKPIIGRIDDIKGSISSLNDYVSQENKLSEKLKLEREKIENEISVLEGRFNRELSMIQNVIHLKNKQVSLLSEEIIEKERLFKVERTAKEKILQKNFQKGLDKDIVKLIKSN